MGPFVKTLFGDARNVAVVAVLLVVEALLIHSGQGAAAAVLVPLVTLGGAAWLAAG